MSFSKTEIKRYLRHFSLDEIGMEGQSALKLSSVLCVGAGGLGSPALLYLASAGVGRIGIVDHDVVDITNLQRQVLYTAADLGRKKSEIAKGKITSINPHVEVDSHPLLLDESNALEIISRYDLILDGTDNFEAKYLINDACVELGKPWVYASIDKFIGQCAVFLKDGPCYRCLYPSLPPADLIPNCEENGVLGVLPGVMGSIQATEAIKLIAQIGDTLHHRLLTFDALTLHFKEFRFSQRKDCPACAEKKGFSNLNRSELHCASEPEQQEAPLPDVKMMTPWQLKQKLDAGKEVLLIDVRERYEHEYSNMGGENFPFSRFEESIPEIDSLVKNRDIPVVLYCKAGGRSRRATDLLSKAGLKNVFLLEGGLRAWFATFGSKNDEVL